MDRERVHVGVDDPFEEDDERLPGVRLGLDGLRLLDPAAQPVVAQSAQQVLLAGISPAERAHPDPGPFRDGRDRRLGIGEEDPFSPSGRIEGDPGAHLAAALDASAGAWATVDDDAEQVPVPLPQGPMPTWLAAGACALDAAVHAWDIAVATGRPSPLTPRMARPLMEVATRIVEPLRAYGAYAPAVEAGDDADEVAVLLAYLGRRPI
ncbi:TIGR03086 family metal-binding protein [Microbispora siamensis]